MDPVLKRKLFMEPPVRKAGGGIMDLVEDDEEDPYANRTPDSPEIIANNLRGDIRSMDERYLELAQMVGEQAFETPEEVVVLLQAQLAQQGAQGQQPAAPAPGPQGLASLAQGIPPGGEPPGGAMPPQMPPQMSQGEAPVMQAPGGIEALVAENEEAPAPVQRSQGSGMRGEVAQAPNAYTGEGIPPGDMGVDDFSDEDLDNELAGFVSQGGDLDVLLEAAATIPEVQALPLDGEPMDYSVLEGSTPELSLARSQSKQAQNAPGSAGSAAAMARLASMLPKTEGGSSNTSALANMAASGGAALRDMQRRRQQDPRDRNNILLQSIFTNLEPVRRSDGSPPLGERREPFFRIDDEINQPKSRGARIPAWQQQLIREGVLPETPDRSPKSRPLTSQELEDLVRRKEAQGPLARRVYDFARARGIDPNVLENRVRSLINSPVGRAASTVGRTVSRAFNPLVAGGLLAADFGQKMAPSIYMAMNDLTPIPSEFLTERGVLPGVNPLPVSPNRLPDGRLSLANKIPPAVPDGGVPVTIPGLRSSQDSGGGGVGGGGVGGGGVGGGGNTFTDELAGTLPFGGEDAEEPPRRSVELTPEAAPRSDVMNIGDVQAEESYSMTRGRDPQGAVLMPRAASSEAEAAALVPKQPGESDKDFATRVRKRARLYKELLGDNEAARKAQAYGILAEVGFRLAGAKGRSLGERLSKGMEGAGAALGQLVANEEAARRQLTTAAISSVEQEDRDAARYAAQLAAKQADILSRFELQRLRAADNQNLAARREEGQRSLAEFRAANQLQLKMMEIEARKQPRVERIALRAQLITAQTPNITPEGATRFATMFEDGLVFADELGNIRDKSNNNILAYGVGAQPTPQGGAGYIPDNFPFLERGKPTVAPAFTVEEMQKARDDRTGAQSLLGGLQRAKGNLAAAYGPMNVITRGITSVVQPIVGNIGPFSADNFGAANAIRQFQKELRDLLVLNPNRATKYELELMAPLMDNPNNILKSPDIALANLLEIERTLVNRINAADHRLNPNVPYKQIGRLPLGTKNDPLPPNSLNYMGEHFKAIPNATVYYRREDGVVTGMNKQQYDQMMRGMRQQ